MLIKCVDVVGGRIFCLEDYQWDGDEQCQQEVVVLVVFVKCGKYQVCYYVVQQCVNWIVGMMYFQCKIMFFFWLLFCGVVDVDGFVLVGFKVDVYVQQYKGCQFVVDCFNFGNKRQCGIVQYQWYLKVGLFLVRFVVIVLDGVGNIQYCKGYYDQGDDIVLLFW